MSHYYIDLYKIKEKYPEADVETLALAEKGFEAFLTWWDQTKFTVVETEMALVSEKFRYGGTPDAIFMKDDDYYLGDWKCGNRIYTDHIVQLAAYRNLWEEHNPGKKLMGGHILRTGKQYGDFHHHSWPNEVIDMGWESFKYMRRLYDIDKQLKKAVG